MVWASIILMKSGKESTLRLTLMKKIKKKAEEQVENMCKKLLANLVIEDYRIIGSQ